jgi:hypothetical protein
MNRLNKNYKERDGRNKVIVENKVPNNYKSQIKTQMKN